MNVAPPAPPLVISDYMKAKQTGFWRAASGWEGQLWHPTPVRQFMVAVAGRFAVTASDGSMREFGAGDILLLEDTHGKGHSTEVLGDDAAVLAVIHLG